MVEAMKKPQTRAEQRRMTSIKERYRAMENTHTFGRRRAKGKKTFIIQNNDPMIQAIQEEDNESDKSMKKMELGQRRGSKSNSGSHKSRLSAQMRRKAAF
jgi:hypothetical protein